MKTAPPLSKTTRAQKNAATTEALLTAAAQAFAERGYEATTMEQIAERVGLSKGALYYRYRSKEDLFLALLDERCAAYIAQLEQTPAAGWGAFAEQFLAIVREGTWPRLFFEFVAYASRRPRPAANWSGGHEPSAQPSSSRSPGPASGWPSPRPTSRSPSPPSATAWPSSTSPTHAASRTAPSS